jgi:hypothetical protein
LNVAVLAVGAATAPLAARAQQPAVPPPSKEFGVLVGAVNDSIRGGPLVGALVSITGSPRQAKTDARGNFRIDSIVPGQVVIVVTHPMLDSLGLMVRSAPFMLGGGQRLRATLSTASLGDLSLGPCPPATEEQTSILIGRVTTAETGEAAASARISFVYTEPLRAKSPDHVRTARVGATGLFIICGLPSTVAGNVQASIGSVATADLPVSLNNEAIAVASLAIGAPGGVSASLRGSVRMKGGAPVGGAQVAVTGTSALAVTADDGSFTLRGLPPGTQETIVRKIGFAPASRVVALAAHDPTTLNVFLDTARVLSAVKVESKLDDGLAKVGFSDRKRSTGAWFLTPDQIDRAKPLLTTDVLHAAAGLRVASGNGGTVLQAMRGSSMSTGSSGGCINIFLDRARFQQMQPGDVDAAIPANELGAVEFYSGATTTPPEFSVPGTTCATLVLWSKTLLATRKP